MRLLGKFTLTGDIAVYYPEPEDALNWNPEGDAHTNWERDALVQADVILFWIPRNLKHLPGLRTNVEWGFWIARNPGKLVLGYPSEDTPGTNSMRNDARLYGIPTTTCLSKGLELALGKILWL